MFKVIAICLLVVFARGQWSSQTASSAGAAVSSGNGVIVGLVGPGYVYGSELGLTTAATATTGDAIYVTLITTTTGANIGAGYLRLAGAAGSACATFPATGTRTTLVGAGPLATATCPADFITIYSSAQTTPASTSVMEAGTPVRLTSSTVSYKFVLTTPTTTAAGTATSACIITAVTPYTIATANGVKTATAGVAVTYNAGGTCETTGNNANAGLFSLYFTGAIPMPKYAWYVELVGSATASGSVCFQNQAQFTANPGTCLSGSILSGVLASIGLIVAIFFN